MIRELTPEWRLVRLGNCLRRRKETIAPAPFADEIVSVLGLEDIQDGGRGGVSIRSTKAAAVESLETVFRRGDILYGKLRPYLNKVGIAPCDGICSTEIWAFAAEPFLHPYFAYTFLSSPFFVKRVSSLTKGANLPRLDVAVFESIEIPIPTMSEQRRIVETLQEAERVRGLKQAAETKTSELVPAIFQQMFGDVVSNPRNWPMRTVSEFVETFEAGKSLPDGGPEISGGLRVLKISAVTSGRFDATESKPAPTRHTPSERHFVRPGDFLLSRANTAELVGATALVDQCPPNLLLSDKLWRFIWKEPEKVAPDFMAVLFRMPGVRQKISRVATGTGGSMKNISMEQLMSLRLHLPPADHQFRFARAVKELRQIHNLSGGDEKIAMLSSSLQAHAFTGQLTAEWRESNLKALKGEAAGRDVALRTTGATISGTARIITALTVVSRRRDGAYAELTREQHAVLEAVQRRNSGMNSSRWFTAQELAKNFEGPLRGNRHAIEVHLGVLAARGLVIAVSREEPAPITGEIVYGNAYRLPLDEFLPKGDDPREPVQGESARLRELERLAALLRREPTQ